MLNFLPKKEKKTLLYQRILERVIAISLLILVFFLFLSALLFGLNFLVSERVKAKKAELEQKTNRFTSSSELRNFQKTTNILNQKLAKFTAFYQQPQSVVGTLKEVSQACPPNVYFTNIFFRIGSGKWKNTFGTASLAGYAKTREDLFALKESLAARSDFYDVYVFPQSWRSPHDINFSLSFKVKKIK